MRKNKGFTLIEVMVVLSILALIAILAYNFFGSTMKEAAQKQAVTQLIQSLRVVDDAWTLYETKSGNFNTGFSSDCAALVADGTIKSIPTAPSGGRTGGAGGLYCDGGIDDYGGPSTETDDIIWVDGSYTEEVCAAFNAQMCPGCGGDVWVATEHGDAGLPTELPIAYCYGDRAINYISWFHRFR